MLKIGEFSALSTISISMLRNYDKLGLLVPVHVDDMNGYRYYDKEQLLNANKIVAMKTMGFGLDEIKEALDMTPEQLTVSLQKKLAQKQKEQSELEEQIHKIEETMKLKDQEEEYALTVVQKMMPSMHVVCYRGHIHAFHEEGILWKELTKECAMYGIHTATNGVAMAIQHAFCYEEKDVDVEVMLTTDKKYKDCGNLFCKTMLKREVASIIFQGSYSQIGKINTFVAKWLETNQYEICDKPFTIYHNSPHNSKKETEFLTEICFPICHHEN